MAESTMWTKLKDTLVTHPELLTTPAGVAAGALIAHKSKDPLNKTYTPETVGGGVGGLLGYALGRGLSGEETKRVGNIPVQDIKAKVREIATSGDKTRDQRLPLYFSLPGWSNLSPQEQSDVISSYEAAIENWKQPATQPDGTPTVRINLVDITKNLIALLEKKGVARK